MNNDTTDATAACQRFKSKNYNNHKIQKQHRSLNIFSKNYNNKDNTKANNNNILVEDNWTYPPRVLISKTSKKSYSKNLQNLQNYHKTRGSLVTISANMTPAATKDSSLFLREHVE